MIFIAYFILQMNELKAVNYKFKKHLTSDVHYLAILSFLKMTDHQSREALMIIRLRHYGDQIGGPMPPPSQAMLRELGILIIDL